MLLLLMRLLVRYQNSEKEMEVAGHFADLLESQHAGRLS